MLRDCNGRGGMEAWIAGQPWQAAGDGWVVLDNLQSWVFQVAPGLGGEEQSARDAPAARRGSEPRSRFQHRPHGVLP